MKTLVIIDVQNDFMPGAPLEVAEGNLILSPINQIMGSFDLVVATQDWHPQNHKSFASNHPNKNPFEVIELHGLEQTLWPDHCVQGSKGAEVHPGLKQEPIEAIFRKGTDPDIDSYSGFFDNGHRKNTGLSGYLKGRGCKDLYFCGLAADICVFYSISDALEEGFQCWCIEDATRPLDKGAYEKLKQELMEKGVRFIQSANV